MLDSLHAAFDAYQKYLALKLHFSNKDFDAIKYNFKTKGLSLENFRNRREAYWFGKIAKKYPDEVIQAFTAQFVEGKKYGGMFEGEAFDVTYQDWKRRIQSLTYLYEEDLKYLAENIPEAHLVDLLVPVTGWSEKGNVPFLVKEYYKGKVNLESVVVLDKLTGFVRKSDDKIADRIKWPRTAMLIRKYSPLLPTPADLGELRTMLLKYFPLRNPL